MLNYLARLGWSHGDEELFTREQMVAGLTARTLSKSPAQWDPAKLAWVNAQYLKAADDARLAGLVATRLGGSGPWQAADRRMAAACVRFVQGPLQTTVEIAEWAARV